MCGVLGIFGDKNIDEEKFNNSLKLVSHRGPDNLDSIIMKGCALGHTRLSIIDLSKESNQPFKSTDGRYYLVFNGEIFNYLEIKHELQSLNVSFRTDSDTEVLLNSYIKWGESCVNRFNGMWAFIIYDSEKKSFFASRDRFGIKPLYYTKYNNQIIVSSEIKSILNYYPELAIPNYNIISNYCRTSIGGQHIETWFNNIFRVKPSNNMIIDNMGYKFEKYWDYPNKVDKSITFKKAVSHYKKLFLDAVKIRLRSDVSIGITMSSGLDSTSIASTIKKINSKIKFNTYTARFKTSDYRKEEKQNYKHDIDIDEFSIVKRLTNHLDMKSNPVDVNYNDYINKLKKLIWYLESGHGSPAIYPLDQVMDRAKKDVKVVLEGQGADELLGGYINVAIIPFIWSLIKKFKFKNALSELKNISKHYSLTFVFILFIRQLNIYFINKIYFKFFGIENLFQGNIKKYKHLKDYPNKPKYFDNYFNKYLFQSHTGGLVNLLHYGDAVSMKSSIESRLPFMDYRLVEFAFRIPIEYKIRNGQGKYIHRKAMEGILPDYILNNKIKFGFDSPLSNVLFKEGENSVKSIIFSERCLNRGLFNKNALLKLFEKSKTNRINTTRYIFRILSVELWFRTFIDKKN